MLPTLLWDASSIVKYYVAERGSEAVAALFGMTPAFPMVLTIPGYGETYALLRRRMNAGHLSRLEYDIARTALRNEVFLSPAFKLLAIEHMVEISLPLIDRHNINSTDATILAAYKVALSPTDPLCVLVASDQRLLRAARAEGLPTLDPEAMAAADIPSYLNSS